MHIQAGPTRPCAILLSLANLWQEIVTAVAKLGIGKIVRSLWWRDLPTLWQLTGLKANRALTLGARIRCPEVLQSNTLSLIA